MDAERIELIENVFCDVFENLAFMFGEPISKDVFEANGNEHTHAHISFEGARTGDVVLIVPDDMCPEIAANVLGVDPDDEQVDELAGDALKEMINIICGRLLTDLESKDLVFDLSVPEIKNINSEEWSVWLKKEGSLGFIVDEYSVILYLHMED